MKEVIIYTDGACSGNPGPGGWAVVLLHDRHERVLSGAARDTTNNRMELRAALEGLRALKEPCKVSIYTDSRYLSRAFNEGWIDNWQNNGWRTSSKKPVQNKDLWKAILDAMDDHEVDWHWVKGHAEDPLNNRVDELAVAAMEKAKF
jgi:ribonuclease HI